MIKSIDFIINILVHMLIILSILTIFFWLFVSKKETRILENEFTTNINNGFQGLKDSFTPNQQDRVNNVINNIQPGLKVFKTYFEKPDKTYIAKNNCLKQNNIRLIIYLIILIIFVSIIYHYFCGSNVHFLEILKENFIIFALIGIFEFFFFREIADKFIPIKPSFISNKISKDVKKKFNL